MNHLNQSVQLLVHAYLMIGNIMCYMFLCPPPLPPPPPPPPIHTQFALMCFIVFQHCPWLVRGVSDSSKDLELLISDWKTHKYKKPLRGAILLNQDWTKVSEVLSRQLVKLFSAHAQ